MMMFVHEKTLLMQMRSVVLMSSSRASHRREAAPPGPCPLPGMLMTRTVLHSGSVRERRSLQEPCPLTRLLTCTVYLGLDVRMRHILQEPCSPLVMLTTTVLHNLVREMRAFFNRSHHFGNKNHIWMSRDPCFDSLSCPYPLLSHCGCGLSWSPGDPKLTFSKFMEFMKLAQHHPLGRSLVSVMSAYSTKTAPVDQSWSRPRAGQSCPHDRHPARSRSPFRTNSPQSRFCVCPSPSRSPLDIQVWLGNRNPLELRILSCSRDGRLSPGTRDGKHWSTHSPPRGRKRVRSGSRSPAHTDLTTLRTSKSPQSCWESHRSRSPLTVEHGGMVDDASDLVISSSRYNLFHNAVHTSKGGSPPWLLEGKLSCCCC